MDLDPKTIAELDQFEATVADGFDLAASLAKEYLREDGGSFRSSTAYWAVALEMFVPPEQLATIAAYFLLKEAKRQLDEESGHVFPTL